MRKIFIFVFLSTKRLLRPYFRSAANFKPIEPVVLSRGLKQAKKKRERERNRERENENVEKLWDGEWLKIRT